MVLELLCVSSFSFFFFFLYQVLPHALQQHYQERTVQCCRHIDRATGSPICLFSYGTSIRILILLLLLLVSCPYIVRRVNTIKRGQVEAADTSIKLQVHPYAYSYMVLVFSFFFFFFSCLYQILPHALQQHHQERTVQSRRHIGRIAGLPILLIRIWY